MNARRSGPVVVSFLVVVSLVAPLLPAGAQESSARPVSLLAAGRGSPAVNLLDGRPIEEVEARPALVPTDAKPLSLAAGDFDEDGAADLVTGYAVSGGTAGTPEGGLVTLRRGDADALYPNSAAAALRRFQGTFTDAAFFDVSTRAVLPEAPEFLSTGDFDGDGHRDIVTAGRGSATLYCLLGDGRGGLREGPSLSLPGGVTALVGADVNRRDGLADVLVATGGPRPMLLTFEGPGGALTRPPDSLELPAEAHALAVGQLDGDSWVDVALAFSGQLGIMRGRDRELSVHMGDDILPSAASLETWRPPSGAVAIAVGDYLGIGHDCLAILDEVGDVGFVDPRQPGGPGALAAAARTVAGAAMAKGGRAGGASLVTTHTSLTGADDVLVFVSGSRDLALVTGSSTGYPFQAALESPVLLEATSPLVAVLPMRLNADAQDDLVLLQADTIGQVSTAVTAMARTFWVNSGSDAGDADPNDGVCATQEGKCTLVAAVTECNKSGDASCEFRFNLPTGQGVPEARTPAYASAANQGLFVVKPHVIDGTSQPGGWVRLLGAWFLEDATMRGVITSDGFWALNDSFVEGNRLGTNDAGTATWPRASANVWGNLIKSTTTVGGTVAAARNVIANGLHLYGSDNTVQGNYFALDPTGSHNIVGAAGLTIDETGDPFFVAGDPRDNTVGGTEPGAGNVFAGSGFSDTWAIRAEMEVRAALIQGNSIGTNPAGTDIFDPSSGIYFAGLDSTIGGTVPAARNVIVGNDGGGPSETVGIRVEGTGLLIQGNYIGTDKTGSASLGSTDDGVYVGAYMGTPSSVTIGGAVPDAGNVIAGGLRAGVRVYQNPALVNGVRIQGNRIGTDAAGSAALANGMGILIQSSSGVLVGGLTALARNVISGNDQAGINIIGAESSDNYVQGNYIGLASDGTGALGNAFYGIWIQNEAKDNMVGGLDDGAGNVIAHNHLGGVYIQGESTQGGEVWPGAGTGNAVLRNTIYDNTRLGIDLGDRGVTPNDPNDQDTGPNDLQNAPVLVETETATGLAVRGTLHSRPGHTFRIEIYVNCAPDEKGFYEAERYLGATEVTTSSMGDALFYVTLSYTGSCRFLTATATDMTPRGGGSDTPLHNTSELSEALRYEGWSWAFSPVVLGNYRQQ